MALLMVAAGAHWLLPVNTLGVTRFKLAGIVFFAAGFGVMIQAWWQFKQARVAICPTDKTDRLITDGIYRLSRNPMYLGMVSMLTGIALWSGSLPFYAAAATYFIILDRVFSPYEEAKLGAAFADRYADYAARVRRWI